MQPASQLARLTKLALIVSYLLILILLPLSIQAQSCSCGGPPLLGSLESGLSSKGTLGFSVTYEYSSISDLVEDDTQIPDNIRSRTIRSTLFQSEYGVTDRLSFSTLFSVLQQSRTTTSGQGSGETLKTNSLGDALLLGKYAIWPISIHQPYNFSIGGGIKAPLGKSTLRSNGILVSADMQPGTGSWDFLLWTSGGYSLSRKHKIALFASGLYRINGTNDRFGDNKTDYQFGNELIINSGINHDLNLDLSGSLAIRYRQTKSNKFNSNELPNSGGHWLNLVPGLNYRLSEPLSIRGSGQIPLYRKVNGLQFSTSYSVALTLFYSLNLINQSTLKI